MPKASNDPETEAFIQEYRRQKAARGGQGYINGVPSEVALGRSAPTIVTNNAAPRQSYPAVTPEQRDRAMATAELLGAQRGNEQMLQADEGQDRYNRFLQERGINPNRIGAATVRDVDGQRVLSNPSLTAQEAAVNAGNAYNAGEGRDRIAARRAYLRGDAGQWANTIGRIDRRREAIPEDFQKRSNFWYEQLYGASPWRSNGYGF